jgi:hypothetical protein
VKYTFILFFFLGSFTLLEEAASAGYRWRTEEVAVKVACPGIVWTLSERENVNQQPV